MSDALAPIALTLKCALCQRDVEATFWQDRAAATDQAAQLRGAEWGCSVCGRINNFPIVGRITLGNRSMATEPHGPALAKPRKGHRAARAIRALDCSECHKLVDVEYRPGLGPRGQPETVTAFRCPYCSEPNIVPLPGSVLRALKPTA